MKKFLTLLALVLVVIQVGTLLFVSAAQPQDFGAYLVTHWDFEGDNPLLDKATIGNSADDLTIQGAVIVENGVAVVSHTQGSYMETSASAEGGDLHSLQNKTIVIKVKTTQPDPSKTNGGTLIYKPGAIQTMVNLVNDSDSQSPYDMHLRVWDGGTAGDNRITNVNGNDTQNWMGPDDTYHYYIASYAYEGGQLTQKYYYSKTAWPKDSSEFVEMYTETLNASEQVLTWESSMLFGKAKATDSDRGTEFSYDDIKIYNKVMSIDEVYGTLEIDFSEATATTTVATTKATTAATTKAATTKAATTKAATTVAATTAAGTTAAATTTVAEEGGCGGVIALPAVALVGAVTAVGCMSKRKKK